MYKSPLNIYEVTGAIYSQRRKEKKSSNENVSVK